jgi:hypothetical protein
MFKLIKEIQRIEIAKKTIKKLVKKALLKSDILKIL